MVVFFSWISFANASVLINEIQLSPTEERFIELYNTGSSAIDLTNWYIQRKTASGSTFGSLVSKTYFEGESITSGGYFVISRSSINYTDIIIENLTLTESNTIQIKNQDQEIVDKVEWGSISDNKSIQKNSNGDWEEFSPTPGEVNQNFDSTDSGNDLTEENIISNSSSYISQNQQEVIIRKITAKIITPKIVFAGIPFSIEPLIITNKKENLNFGKFKWNFGDGAVGESHNLNSFEHIYFYPGEYVISLNYSEQYNFKLDVSVRKTVRVVPSEIIISSIGIDGDAFIELENKSKYEMVLSGWVITAGVRSFMIPEGTVILPKKKLKFSPRITGFVKGDLNLIIMTDSKGEVVNIFPAQKVKSQKQITSIKSIYKNPLPVEKNIIEESPLIINLNDLSASANNAERDISMSVYSYWGLGAILIIGISAVILIYRRKDTSDYLEEEIRAEDMTIIE